MMTDEPSALESVRLAHVKLAHITDPACDEIALSHAKTRVLNFLVDLEAEWAIIHSLSPSIAEIEMFDGQADLMPPLSPDELEALEDAVNETPLHKLD